jgi:hypothetical protein
MKESQRNKILFWLLSGKSLTKKQSEYLFGCRNTGARIEELRKSEYHIETSMIKVRTRDGHTRVAKYFMP